MDDGRITRRRLLGAAGGTGLAWAFGRLTGPSGLVECALETRMQPLPPARPQPRASHRGGIEKVVILFLENRTYDNVAGDVRGGDGAPWLPLSGDWTDGCWNGHPLWLLRDRTARRERYSRAQLPALYSLMDAYTVCDRFFTDFAGPSLPNHLYAVAADAGGVQSDSETPPRLRLPTLPQQIERAGRSWAYYGDSQGMDAFAAQRPERHRRSVADFAGDCRRGRLADVTWVYPGLGNDFHPNNAPIQQSDAWLRGAVEAIAGGRLRDGRRLWDHVHVVITFDDWGGWYDHVTPPVVERLPNGEPSRYGSRVPCIAVGPYARAGHVSHEVGSFVSIVAFVERLFGLPPLNHRTAVERASALRDTVDLRQRPLEPPRWLSDVCTRSGWPHIENRVDWWLARTARQLAGE